MIISGVYIGMIVGSMVMFVIWCCYNFDVFINYVVDNDFGVFINGSGY